MRPLVVEAGLEQLARAKHLEGHGHVPALVRLPQPSTPLEEERVGEQSPRKQEAGEERGVPGREPHLKTLPRAAGPDRPELSHPLLTAEAAFEGTIYRDEPGP